MVVKFGAFDILITLVADDERFLAVVPVRLNLLLSYGGAAVVRTGDDCRSTFMQH